jgi:nicotinamidase-related amidase
MQRLAELIRQAGAGLDDITVTLDSHPSVAVERTTFWLDAAGQEVNPYTQVARDDVVSGRFRPRHERHLPAVLDMLARLENAGHYTLVAWPVHCVTGTWGHNIHRNVANQLAAWERDTGQTVRKVLKGEYPLAEHYGVFEAETPLAQVASTAFNHTLAENLSNGVDLLFVAGEASSHCVAASVDQLIRFRRGDGHGIVLLSDAMSPVGGFEAQARAFFERAQKTGAQIMTTTQAIDYMRSRTV